jgi:hypothetical protein
MNMAGEPGFAGWLDPRDSLEIHKLFRWPLAGLLVIHAAITVYFALRRWGWIRAKARS